MSTFTCLPPCIRPHADGVPIPRELHPLAFWLVQAGYSPRAIDGALEDVARYGSAWASPWIDLEDLDAVEALIPGVHPDGWGPEWDADVWTTD